MDYSSARKPWVTVLLISALVYYVGKVSELEKDKSLLRDRLEAKSDKLTEYAIQVAQLSNEARRATDKIISYQDTSSADRRDFDSPAHAE